LGIHWHAQLKHSKTWTADDLAFAREQINVLESGNKSGSGKQLILITVTERQGTYFGYSEEWSRGELLVAAALVNDLELVSEIVGDTDAEGPFSVTTEVDLPV
jgi:hypothetical protein